MNEEIRGPHTSLEEITVGELQAAMTSGEITAQRLTEMYLERISALHHQSDPFQPASGPSAHQ